MSLTGIKITAEAFEFIQTAQEKLFRLGTPRDTQLTEEHKQDILLAQMLRKMTERTTNEFCKITMMDQSKKGKKTCLQKVDG